MTCTHQIDGLKCPWSREQHAELEHDLMEKPAPEWTLGDSDFATYWRLHRNGATIALIDSLHQPLSRAALHDLVTAANRGSGQSVPMPELREKIAKVMRDMFYVLNGVVDADAGWNAMADAVLALLPPPPSHPDEITPEDRCAWPTNWGTCEALRREHYPESSHQFVEPPDPAGTTPPSQELRALEEDFEGVDRAGSTVLKHDRGATLEFVDKMKTLVAKQLIFDRAIYAILSRKARSE